MPTVPITQPRADAPMAAKVSPLYLAMAAAEIHNQAQRKATAEAAVTAQSNEPDNGRS